ncbi:MAG: hypothetical protein ACR2IT_09240, partial [Pirellulales bacterium]
MTIMSRRRFRDCSSTTGVPGPRCVGLACLIVLAAASGVRGQSTWLPTSGTIPWLTGTAWSGAVIPDASGAVAVFPNAGVWASVLSST